MSNSSDLFGGGGGKLRYQRFTSSGTFTPSAALLAKGGQVFLDIRGGGGGGYAYAGLTAGSSGGNSKHITRYTVTGACTVTIGAGGIGASTGVAATVGGNTTFDALTIAGAGNSGSISPGYGTGNEGTPGQLGLYGANNSFNASQPMIAAAASITANSGSGGAPGANGQAGIVEVWWWE